jgi:flagellar biosynthesis protein FliR
VNQLVGLFGEQTAAGFILVLGRVGPLFLVAPLFSSKMIPARARGVLAVALAVGLSPLARHDRQLPLDVGSLGILLGKEILVGLAFAFTVSAVLAAIQAAGSFLDTLVGFSFGAAIDPITGAQSNVLSQLYGLIGVMIFVAIGGDALMVQGLARTYDLVPLTAMPSLALLTAGAVHAFTGIFAAALELAAPVVLALVITDAAFGMLARVVPQLNVFAVGFPAKIAVGLLVVIASLPFAAGWISDQLTQSVGDALHTIRVA